MIARTLLLPVMGSLSWMALVSSAALADVIIDSTNGNGGFASATIDFNGSLNQWTALRGVWVMSSNTSLATLPFGPDTAADSRAIQIHNDAGETLTSTVNFSVQAGDPIALNFDYKTGGSGNNTTLTASLWDPSTNTTFATLGSVSTATAQNSYLQKTYSITAPAAASTLRLRFTLTSAGGTGKDFHIDRVHLNGGTVVIPPPPAPIVYATQQTLVDGDTAERMVEKAAKTLPRANQVTWQRMEHTYFIHFGVNTFRGVEWGTGYESPSVFNPTALDAAQWVREIKQAGGKQVMLVAKHHDGFCLWPSRYTAQDVASSPWLGGNGNVVKAVSEACQAQGIKFGVYISPADLYQIHADETAGNPEGYYGNGSAIQATTIPTDPTTFKSNPATGRTPVESFGPYTYQVNDYNRYFLNQLYELLTEYGPVHQIWFDGANPEPGISETHDYDKWYDLIRKLRPDIVIGIGGADARWVGNENGAARTTEWSVVPQPMSDITATDLGSRTKLTIGSTLSWFPAEADVPLLNGWFWSASKTPKSAAALLGLHYSSVGRNSNLLLNLSPDTRGLIPDNQLASLRPFGQIVRNTFAVNLAAGATVTSPVGSLSQGSLAADNDLDTFWEGPDGSTTGELVLDLPTARTFDIISVQEAIVTRSQRVEGFAVDTWNGTDWSTQATATTIGHKRLLKLASPVTTQRIRLRITASRWIPAIAEVSLFKEAVSISAPTISNRDASGRVTLSGQSGLAIRYTLDGSTPSATSSLYENPIDLQMGGTITAASFGSDDLPGIFANRAFPNRAPLGWSAPANAADDNPSTVWQSATGLPQSLTIDMGSAKLISGFTYLPPSGGGAGTILSYQFHTSEDGTNWTLQASGDFQNIVNNPVLQQIDFARCMARHIRLTALAEVTSGNSMKVAELGVVPAGFDAWLRDQGMPATSATSDADGDGRPLWQEYAQLSNPLKADFANPTIEWNSSDPLPLVEFRRDPLRFDVTHQLEASDNLINGSWQAVEVIEQVVATGADGVQTVRLVESNPPAATSQRFYRVKYSSR